MSGDLFGGENLEAARERIRTPPPAPPKEPKFSAWKTVTAPVRGVREAVGQGLASGAEVMGMFGEVLGANPEAFGIGALNDQQRWQADVQRAKLQREGLDPTNPVAESLRASGAMFRPDPVDAHAAEQVLYGFARGAAKVVGGAVAAGPAGVIGAGLEEGITQTEEFRKQGVPFGPRVAAGAVQGAGLAMAALPLIGNTLGQTAALYVAGGPGGFMAQQALTREILRSSSPDIAEQFDPFDPVGVTVAFGLPAWFTARGVRQQRMRAGLLKEIDAQRVAPDVPRDVVDAAMVQNLSHARDAADARLLASVESVGRPVESLDQFVLSSGIKAQRMPAPVESNFLGWVRTNGGINIAEKFDITGEKNAVRANPAGVFRRGGTATDDLAQRAADEGYLAPDQAGDTGAFVELVKRAVNGERVLTFEQQAADAARLTFEQETAVRVSELERRLEALGVDPKPAKGDLQTLEAYMARNEPALLAGAVEDLRALRNAGDDMPEFDALRQRARQLADDITDTARTVDQWESEIGPLSPVMRRMVGDELALRSSAVDSQPSANPQATVPRAEPVPPRHEATAAEAATPGATAEAAAASARIEQLRAEFPDLTVMLDGMDAPMRLDDFLATVKAEADEMTADAPLLQVAAECAIINGLA